MDGQEHHQHTGNIIISTSVSDTGIPEPCEPTVRLALRSFTTTPSTSSRTPACMLLCSNRHWFTVAADVKSSTGSSQAWEARQAGSSVTHQAPRGHQEFSQSALSGSKLDRCLQA